MRKESLYIPRRIKPDPCFFPTRTTCAGWSTTDIHCASSPNCRLLPLLEKRAWCFWYWRHLAQTESSFEFMRGRPDRIVLCVDNCHGLATGVRYRTENMDRMVFWGICLLVSSRRGCSLACWIAVVLFWWCRFRGGWRRLVLDYRKSQRTSSDDCQHRRRRPTTRIASDHSFLFLYLSTSLCDRGYVLPGKSSGGYRPCR